MMGIEGSGGGDSPAMNAFWLALAFIIVGTGFLKANTSVMVGQLYPRTDVRRDGAYTIFYMGINLGAALGSLLCGYLGEVYGWKYGFGAAGFGMRSEEHTSELQSLMRISYAVFCLKKKK